MKPKFTFRTQLDRVTGMRAPVAGLCLFAAAMASHAQTNGTWTANAAGNWSTTTNWSGGTVADGIDANVYLSNVINADRIITLDSNRSVGNIYAQDTTNNYTISGSNTLTLDVTSGQSILDVVSGRTLTIGTALAVNDGISKAGAGAVSITGAVSLGADQTWTNNTSGAVSKTNASLLSNNGFQLTFSGTGTFNLGTINNATAVLAGSGALVKEGSGRLNIGGINSGFSGSVTINGGILQMHNDPGGLGNGNLTLNGGVLSSYWGMTYTRTLGTGAGAVQILGGQSGFAGAGTTGPTFNLGPEPPGRHSISAAASHGDPPISSRPNSCWVMRAPPMPARPPSRAGSISTGLPARSSCPMVQVRPATCPRFPGSSATAPALPV